MTITRRMVGILASVAGATIFAAQPARAQSWPTHPLRIVVGFPAGGTIDVVARIVGQYLSDKLGQPVVIENRLGAGGNIGSEFVAHAPADGYTLLAVTSANAISDSLYNNLTFNFSRDFAPVADILRVPLVMVVNPGLPVKTVPDFIAYAKANPGKLNMASAGNGGIQHVAGELFRKMAGVELTHVPYRGASPAEADLMAGNVQVLFDTLPAVLEFIRAGKMRALAVSTAVRQAALPDTPVIADFLPGFEASTFNGVAAPRGTPTDVVALLNRAIAAGLADPDVKGRLNELGGIMLGGSPEDFARLIAIETEKWAEVVRFSGAKPD